jgi:hypothetical protein
MRNEERKQGQKETVKIKKGKEMRRKRVCEVLGKSRDSLVGIALTVGWIIGVLGFDSRQGLRIFLFTTTSRTVLGPTQPSIQ